MRQDVTIALSSYRYIDPNKGHISESRMEMHRDGCASPVANPGKFASHHGLIIAIARQQIDRKIQRPQALRNAAIAFPPSIIHQISGQDECIGPEYLQPIDRSFEYGQRRTIRSGMDIGYLRNKHIVPLDSQ